MNARWLLLGGILGLCTLTAGADDWPQWRGPGRDNKLVGFTAPQTWPKTLTQKWKEKVGLGDASPVLVGDKVYVFTRQENDEVILCLNAATGKEVWKTKTSGGVPVITKGAKDHPGPRGTPAVADGKVYTFGIVGMISCVDAGSGKIAWQKETKGYPGFYTSYSPLIAEGKCIIHSGGGGKGGGKGEMVAYDLATGDEKWKWPGDGPAYSSPVLMTVDGTKMVVSMTDRNIVGIGLADGKLLWKAAFQASRYENTVTPIVDGSTVIYAGSGTGTVAAQVEKKGNEFALKELWKSDQSPHQYNTPVLKDGLIYGISPQRNLYCLNAKDGERAWVDKTARGECGSVLDGGTVLLALTSDQNLLVFKPSNKGYEEVAKYDVADTAPWAMPIITGNRVFVKDRESLALWTIE